MMSHRDHFYYQTWYLRWREEGSLGAGVQHFMMMNWTGKGYDLEIYYDAV
jgi:hypothetical protein